MRILGIDPGYATIGFGVVDSEGGRQELVKCGVITTPAHTSLSSRLEQIYDDLHHIIEYLPQEQREVLVMRIYQDYSFKEISEITGVSINTALGRMRYALINLRKIIAKHKVVIE